MLARTFVFLPGIGPVREARLWKRGISSWSDYRAMPHVKGIRQRLKARHDELLALAQTSLGRDPRFFATVLPPQEQWRAYTHFREGAAYLDIETRGERENNDVTIVGIRLRGKSRTFVRGRDYTPAAVTEFLRDATCIVTFNGQSFDLPMLANDGVQLPEVPSVDLRVVLHRAGYEGGLKRIEETLGFVRDESVRGMSGYDAVKLWRRYETTGDEEALARLVAYNLADFENLEPLADFACDALERKLLSDLMAQTRLPQALAQEAPAGP
ncbi:MAG TPA: ribonuclease H-like domain-containing protein [Candidatus Thermoplasmatota archaeon]|nr:ribonuclease H-like domain-containing protein [Candidatus Thermoplasmatota archaeon]